MRLTKELVAFYYERATLEPVYAAQDPLEFIEETTRKATEKGLIHQRDRLVYLVMANLGDDDYLEDKEDVIEFLKKHAYPEFYAHKSGDWDRAYNGIVSEVREWQKESGDPRFPAWVLRLWDISMRAAKWALEDALQQIDI